MTRYDLKSWSKNQIEELNKLLIEIKNLNAHIDGLSKHKNYLMDLCNFHHILKADDKIFLSKFNHDDKISCNFKDNTNNLKSEYLNLSVDKNIKI